MDERTKAIIAQQSYEADLEREIFRIMRREYIQYFQAESLAARLIRQKRIWRQSFGRKQ